MMLYLRYRGYPQEASEQIDLPPYLADLLNELNTLRQQCDFNVARQRSLCQQLFTDWNQYLSSIDAEIRNIAGTNTQNRIQEIEALNEFINKLEGIVEEKKKHLQTVLGDEMKLIEIAAPKYWRPNDFTIAIEGSEVVPPLRHGRITTKKHSDYLLCRVTDQILTEVTLLGTTINASDFEDDLDVPHPDPHKEVVVALVLEACLLNIDFWTKQTTQSESKLREALWSLLPTTTSSTETENIDQFPLAFGVKWWDSNPWLPLYMEWEAEHHPLHSTEDGRFLECYEERYILDHFQVDPDSGEIVPKADLHLNGTPQHYRGWTLLNENAPSDFVDRLIETLNASKHYPERDWLTQLQDSGMGIAVQSMKGVHRALLQQKQQKVTAIESVPGSPQSDLTQKVADILMDEMFMEPQLNAAFNPIRSGSFKLSLRIVDTFGQRRDIQMNSFVRANALKLPVLNNPDQFYVAPRINQASRLLFRWISANSSELEEMNAPPATSPICGWIITTHLVPGMFLFNQKGKALGTIFLRGDQQYIAWETAPGDSTKINTSIDEALKDEHPVLQQFALGIFNQTADDFKNYWLTLDKAHEHILPKESANGLEVLNWETRCNRSNFLEIRSRWTCKNKRKLEVLYRG
ncbi:hypothetical protein [Paenibacillus polymyxa]|uniref:hypothetical protein n=1 Tax=Paenibacillus polymyxa TaxID=1406 RepID=UPI00234955D6|nr:hypothetical protein [Paenibacillus polymyxa]WCM63787.1 hypothetical protein OYT09_13040 [Paenibacillus polymyxa]